MPLYGPFTVLTYDADGALTDIPASGVHYTADRLTMAEHSALLTPYAITPTNPLQFVMAGYDTDPGNTIPIRFPDAAAAAPVVAQVNPQPE